MNKHFTAYMTDQEKMDLLRENRNKSIINKFVYTFFGFCVIWFGYTIFEFLTV